VTEYARLIQELQLDSDVYRFHGYFRVSTEQFDYVNGAGTTHFTSTNCVRGCVCAGTYDVVRREVVYVRRRTQCERRFRRRNRGRSYWIAKRERRLELSGVTQNLA